MPPKKKSTAIKSRNDKKLTESFKSVKNLKVNDLAVDKATNVDQEDKVVPAFEEILKQYDLNADYGPMIGISRTDRFKRAEYFNLNVADEVKDILCDKDLLQKHPELDLNIWHDIEHNAFISNNKY